MTSKNFRRFIFLGSSAVFISFIVKFLTSVSVVGANLKEMRSTLLKSAQECWFCFTSVILRRKLSANIMKEKDVYQSSNVIPRYEIIHICGVQRVTLPCSFLALYMYKSSALHQNFSNGSSSILSTSKYSKDAIFSRSRLSKVSFASSELQNWLIDVSFRLVCTKIVPS